MKTTVEISDPLVRKAKRLAEESGRTLRELIEEGLRIVVAKGSERSSYELPDRSVGGHGLQPGLSYERWNELLEIANERSRPT